MNESKPDWSKAPAWANYFATDEDGGMWWYECEPHQLAHIWFISAGKKERFRSPDIENWRETLTPRPHPVIVGDTTGEPVGEVWEEGDELFLTHAGTLTNEEPTPNE